MLDAIITASTLQGLIVNTGIVKPPPLFECRQSLRHHVFEGSEKPRVRAPPRVKISTGVTFFTQNSHSPPCKVSASDSTKFKTMGNQALCIKVEFHPVDV